MYLKDANFKSYVVDGSHVERKTLLSGSILRVYWTAQYSLALADLY